MGTLTRATENVYVEDILGVRRLIAAAGDDYDPSSVPAVGIITTPDPPQAGLEPLDDYGQLTEEQVLAQLPDMEPELLQAIQAYERAHRARGSITRYGKNQKILDLPRLATEAPAEPTAADYDAMSPEHLDAEIARRDLKVTGTGKQGNVLKKDNVAALRAHDANAQADQPAE